jgi:hypothetical protein
MPRQIVASAKRAAESLLAQLDAALEDPNRVLAPYCLNEKLELLDQHVRILNDYGVDVVDPE